MNPSDDEQLDLATFVDQTLPALVETEAQWPSHLRLRPATALQGEDSELSAFLRSAGEQPAEGLTRAERVQFWEQRAAAEQAARDAVAGALADHAGMLRLREQQAAADAMERILAGAKPARDEWGKPITEGTQVPVKGPDQPADVGRW